MKHTISALIPIYNESKTIRNIITVVKSCRIIDEIICINDGSTDQSSLILEKIPGIRVIDNNINVGKASAIAKGILCSKGDIIVMIDADLIGFDKKHIEQLVNPLINENYDYSIGWTLYGFVDKLTKPLTGERAYFKKDLLPLISKMTNVGYGLELFLNFNFKDRKGKYIELKNMRHPFKEEKHTFETAVRLNLHALTDITSIILKSDNPPSFFLKAYLPFYRRRESVFIRVIKSHITKIQKLLE